MGRESRVVRDRVCRNCRRPMLTTAPQLKNHEWVCRKVAELGLVMPPTVSAPGSRIIIP